MVSLFCLCVLAVSWDGMDRLFVFVDVDADGIEIEIVIVVVDDNVNSLSL